MTDKTSETKLPDNIDWSNDPTKHKCSTCGHTKEMHKNSCEILTCSCMGFTMTSEKEKCLLEPMDVSFAGESKEPILCVNCNKSWQTMWTFLKERDKELRQKSELKDGIKTITLSRNETIAALQKEISDLKKENEDLKQKLANAESETLDKVIAEIENKIKIIHQLEMMAQHDILIVHGAEQVADKAHNQLEILNELKSALLSMKKETKTE